VAEYLFTNFLKSPQEYKELAAFWHDRVWEQIPSALRGDWKAPWFAKREPALQDGNPIFTAWSETELRGLQIIQVAPDEGAVSDLNLWLDWFGDARDPAAVKKLVVTCVLTTSNLRQIRSLIEQWVIDGCVTERADDVDVTTVWSDASDIRVGVPVIGALA
jgi:hypothetical protein